MVCMVMIVRLILLFYSGVANRVETSSPQPQQVLTKRRIQELLHEIDPQEQMDDDVEDVRLFFEREMQRVGMIVCIESKQNSCLVHEWTRQEYCSDEVQAIVTVAFTIFKSAVLDCNKMPSNFSHLILPSLNYF